MPSKVIELKNCTVEIAPGDMVLSLSRSKFQRFIRWRPGHFGRDRWTGYSHVMGVGTDCESVISAEGNGVVIRPLRDFLENPDYSIFILRRRGVLAEGPGLFDQDQVDMGIRLSVGEELEKLVGLKYSWAGIVGHGLDTLLSLGRRVYERRIFARVLSRADGNKVICSESYALAWDLAAGYQFLKYGTLGRRQPSHATRPRDAEWTAAGERWTGIFKTIKGVPVRPVHNYLLAHPKHEGP